MEIRPILSALLRNKTGAVLVALQVALSLAILANALHIVSERQAVAARPAAWPTRLPPSTSRRATWTTTRRSRAGDHKRQSDTAARGARRGVGGARVNQMPLSHIGSNSSLSVDRNAGPEHIAGRMYVSGDSLVKTLGLQAGRGARLPARRTCSTSTSRRRRSPPNTVIITRALADKLWPGTVRCRQDAVLRHRRRRRGARVVGVVERLQTPWRAGRRRGEYSTIMPARLYWRATSALYAVRTEPGQRDRVMKEAEAGAAHGVSRRR